MCEEEELYDESDYDNAWDNCFAGGHWNSVTQQWSHDPDRED